MDIVPEVKVNSVLPASRVASVSQICDLSCKMGVLRDGAAAFFALIIANLVLAFADSAEVGTSFFDRRRLPFWVIGASATTILAIVLFVPAAARMFSVSLPPPSMIGLAFGVALVAGGWYGFLRRAGLVPPAA